MPSACRRMTRCRVQIGREPYPHGKENSLRDGAVGVLVDLKDLLLVGSDGDEHSSGRGKLPEPRESEEGLKGKDERKGNVPGLREPEGRWETQRRRG
jgi:hypothetical protein